MKDLLNSSSFHASFRSWMIWSIANKEIIDLITTTDLTKIKELSIRILKLTKVSWMDAMGAISDVERQCNPKWH